MQFLKINVDDTLSKIAKRIGGRNIDAVLSVNSMNRSYAVGTSYYDMISEIQRSDVAVSYQRRASVINTLSEDADVFEAAALLSEDEWKVLSEIGTIPGYLRIPNDIQIADAYDILGGQGVSTSMSIYSAVMNCYANSEDVDPALFNSYSKSRGAQIVSSSQGSKNPIQWFNLPWGKISLYSSISGESKDFPVYPEGISDGVTATYETMPDMIYQYEPWYVYTGSGPRTNTYTFDMHRDMWSGNHNDGKCNELIRFCEANCYAEYLGAAVNTATVTLYINGVSHITGIMTDVKVDWDSDSPIGSDGFYLHVKLSLTITEVSQKALSYDVMRNKGLIG